MTPQEIRQIVHQHLAAEARHDATASAATYAPHCYYHHVPLGLRLEGRDAVAAGPATPRASPPSQIASWSTTARSWKVTPTSTGAASGAPWPAPGSACRQPIAASISPSPR